MRMSEIRGMLVRVQRESAPFLRYSFEKVGLPYWSLDDLEFGVETMQPPSVERCDRVGQL